MLTECCGRCYAAFDPNTGKVVRTSARSADPKLDDGVPLDPAEFKIRFTGKVTLITTAKMLRDLINLGCPRGSLVLEVPCPCPQTPAYTWANFNRDVFFLGSFYRHPGLLRFLFHGVNHRIPRDINEDHWAHRIRQLAVYLPIRDPLNELDLRAFSQLRGLRKVFLVFRVDPKEEFNYRSTNHLVKLEKINEYYKWVPEDSTPYLPIGNAEEIRAQLLDVFQKGNRNHITVELMVDIIFKQDASQPPERVTYHSGSSATSNWPIFIRRP
ncbi:hypothetical protein O1611_g992 [Lasiodiplodia mahajangana]|uniref:Uncharacterized protein n=1 Tax=Lasiodiplodia mahajangana TaxID=1108764 RepID=A0ACC2JYT3_9PEZI|nr:hypothetical protein O1611_g992 [Lasiodiplodia mahajangana]